MDSLQNLLGKYYISLILLMGSRKYKPERPAGQKPYALASQAMLELQNDHQSA